MDGAPESVERRPLAQSGRAPALRRRLYLDVPHEVHHGLHIGAAGEEPRRVCVPQLMDTHLEVDPALGGCGHPDVRPKAVPRDGGSGAVAKRRSSPMRPLALTCSALAFDKVLEVDLATIRVVPGACDGRAAPRAFNAT